MIWCIATPLARVLALLLFQQRDTSSTRYYIVAPQANAEQPPDNGDHHLPAEFVTDHVSLFYAKAILVVRTAEGKGGSIRVTAAGEGLRQATASLQSRMER